MNGWNLQPSPMKTKENDLNQTSILVFHPLIFRGVICTKKANPKTGETQKFDESTPLWEMMGTQIWEGSVFFQGESGSD